MEKLDHQHWWQQGKGGRSARKIRAGNRIKKGDRKYQEDWSTGTPGRCAVLRTGRGI